MANPVVMGTPCTCTFGTTPVPIMVSSQQTVITSNTPQATIMDNKFLPFGMCSSLANPAVAAATAAAAGVLTPQPCIPAIAAPWVPGAPTVMVCGKVLLNDSSKLICNFGGVISPTKSPAVTVNTP